ncbi:hypothetical protein PFHG_01818 [Plasmodium falciparum HB3]|uniref:Rab-GAP TBC domain-containing protein n=1 Tax=Plasmodium falciparum (isolate HB3) TaxID=137071 RepID=A0A0L7KAI0_PLAFX|nr:hypothetical protein PFHG_01818 [Plasmodium falciparum HB3]
MRINFFKEKNKIRLNKNLDFDSDIAISNANNESNNYLTANSDNEYDHYGFEKNKEYTQENNDDNKRNLEKYKKKIERRCLNSELESKVLSQIDLDIIRTFPHNKNYRLNSPGWVHLKNVLRAFAVYKPKNKLLSAFWSIVQLIDSDYSHEKINISDYYNNEMRGLRRDIIVIEELIRVKLPDVHLRLKEFDVDLSWICSEWLLCLFCTTFPITTTLRIWDCLFYEGDKIIFRITLALFKLNQQKLCELNSLESILLLFKETTKNMFECDKLMYIAFNEIGVLKKKTIRKLRLKAEDIIKNAVP